MKKICTSVVIIAACSFLLPACSKNVQSPISKFNVPYGTTASTGTSGHGGHSCGGGSSSGSSINTGH